jgi:thioredoxin-related protein
MALETVHARDLKTVSDSMSDGANLHRINFDFVAGRGVNAVGTDKTARIEWSTDVSASLSRAQKEHKPLVVVFTEDYCGWCKVFKGELEKPAMNAVANDAVFLRVAPSKDPKAKHLADLCKVEGYPTISILSVENGKITPVSKVSGYMESNKFIAHLRGTIASIDNKKKAS